MDERKVIRHFLTAALAFFLIVLTVNLCLAQVRIGTKAVQFRLADTAGVIHSLDDYTGRIVVLDFWSFKCPVSLTYDERLATLHGKYRARNVAVLAVASNKNESAVEIRRNRENLRLPFPILLDPDGMLAEGLGATHTPSVVILDGAGIVRYRGAIDNNKRPGEAGRISYVEDALQALLAGKSIAEPETKVFGSSIKR